MENMSIQLASTKLSGDRSMGGYYGAKQRNDRQVCGRWR